MAFLHSAHKHIMEQKYIKPDMEHKTPKNWSKPKIVWTVHYEHAYLD